MEEMMYFFVVVACAMFVIKTIVGWIKSAQYDAERKIRETERKARTEAFDKARLEQLEKFQEKIEKEIEEAR